MEMGALLFFDIDGTLITLDDFHTFPDSARWALLQAKEKGHKIFINTGRVKAEIDKNLKDFPFDGLVCGCGTYIEYEGAVLFHRQQKKEDCIRYAKQLHAYGMETVFEGKDRIFVDGEKGQGRFLEFVHNYFSMNSDKPVGSYLDEDLIYDKFTTYLKKDCNCSAFYECFETDFNLIPHGGKVVEAVPKPYSKATGIRFLQKHLNVGIENCYAFGDSINDMEMLKYVLHSVGMGNAVPPVKEIVEYVTADVKADGLKEALEHYRLI